MVNTYIAYLQIYVLVIKSKCYNSTHTNGQELALINSTLLLKVQHVKSLVANYQA